MSKESVPSQEIELSTETVLLAFFTAVAVAMALTALWRL